MKDNPVRLLKVNVIGSICLFVGSVLFAYALNLAGYEVRVLAISFGLTGFFVFYRGLLMLFTGSNIRSKAQKAAEIIPVRDTVEILPEVVTILDKSDQDITKGQRVRLNDIISGREILRLSNAVINHGQPLTYRALAKGDNSIFTETRLRAIIKDFAKAGLIELPQRSRQPASLTRSGRALLKTMAERAQKAIDYHSPNRIEQVSRPVLSGVGQTDRQQDSGYLLN